jgi:hypothetical protein
VDDDEAEVLCLALLAAALLLTRVPPPPSPPHPPLALFGPQVAYERNDLDGVDIFDVDVTGFPPLPHFLLIPIVVASFFALGMAITAASTVHALSPPGTSIALKKREGGGAASGGGAALEGLEEEDDGSEGSDDDAVFGGGGAAAVAVAIQENLFLDEDVELPDDLE